jgi:hypothetical protein
MTSRALQSASTPLFTVRLSGEQLEALSRCASGISLRFEAPEIVSVLVSAGYAERNVVGVIRVTEEGLRYLQTQVR